jgi:hypothetical protein
MAFAQPAPWQQPHFVAVQRQQPKRCLACGAEPHLPSMAVHRAIWIATMEFGVTRNDILSARRAERLVVARAFVAWACRTLGRPVSYPQLGRRMGRDHSSMINLHMKAVWLRLHDADFRQACDRLAYRFYSMEGNRHEGSDRGSH